MEDPGNILYSGDELSDDQFEKYLSEGAGDDILPADGGTDFNKDAQEGLQSFGSQDKLNAYVQQLNYKLRQQLDTKKQRRNKRKIIEQHWVLLAIIVILLLCTLAFFIIKTQREKKPAGKSIKVAMQYSTKFTGNHDITL